MKRMVLEAVFDTAAEVAKFAALRNWEWLGIRACTVAAWAWNRL